MKPTRYIPILAAAAAALLTASCVKDTLYNTPHPDHGKITVTADWSARGEGLDIPATWTIAMGDYTGTETSATHAPDHLFTPGSYTLVAWNPAEGITVSGTTATVAPASGNQTTGAFIDNTPGWFFTHTEQVSIEKDKDYPLTAAMKQQVRELTLVVEPTGDAADRITEIVAHLTGVAGTLDFATGTYGAASSVVLPFTKITEGADAGKWKATVRLLGVTGTEQLLTGEIRYADGNPTPTTLESDLTEALKDFNAGKDASLTLGGTLVETPEEAEFSGFEISGWEPGQGESGAAEDLGYNYDTTTKTYTVYNADGLLAWNEAAQSDLSINCTLTADIDLTGKTWTPIGDGSTSANSYQGTFDGQGHRITGLAITTDNPSGESAALFGGIGGNGEVKNLQLVDVDYDVRQNGVAGGIAMSNYGTITACSVTGDLSSTGGYVGGIATSNIGSIIGCWFDGNLTSGLGNGGIAGLNYSTITACYYGQNGYPGVAINDGTDDTHRIDSGDSWQPAVDGMKAALTGNDYQWALGKDGLPVLQKKQ